MKRLMPVVVVVLLVGASAAFAAGYGSSSASKPAMTAPSAVMLSGTVSSFDRTRNVLTIRWRTVDRTAFGPMHRRHRQSFLLNPETETLFEGKTEELSSIRPGTVISVAGEREGRNKWVARRIEILKESGPAPLRVSNVPASIPGTPYEYWNY